MPTKEKKKTTKPKGKSSAKPVKKAPKKTVKNKKEKTVKAQKQISSLEIETKAYYNFLSRTQQGISGDANTDWIRAEAELRN